LQPSRFNVFSTTVSSAFDHANHSKRQLHEKPFSQEAGVPIPGWYTKSIKISNSKRLGACAFIWTNITCLHT